MPKKPHPYQIRDKYFMLAKEKGYRARSSFKLLEIQKKFHLIRPGQKIVDLGAAPGSFMQVIREIIGPSGSVLGVDLQEMVPFPFENLKVAQGDIFEKEQFFETVKEFGFEKVDGVTSDLAPKTSGIKDMDLGLSAELTDQAAYLAAHILKPGGYFVGKIFEGSDFQKVLKKIKRQYRDVHVFKPDACRDRSYETYIVAQGFIGAKLNP